MALDLVLVLASGPDLDRESDQVAADSDPVGVVAAVVKIERQPSALAPLTTLLNWTDLLRQ